ncbi:MAG: hypothetical protein BGO26_02265 [Actinobacteria bacterium 69-20]|jgi:calcineurin-like phosphoesterase family protein|nr:metallophosphoesterase [Actinomycetota bacterium]OJV31292.1 MAG: hypothetical protein BGO26_02265 [Actinobacteria bacterium 69-20]
MRFFTSDTHFGHQNIIRYCARPYDDVDRMNDDLVERASNLLADGDMLWHLGDVALGPLTETLPHLGRIPAAVTLVAGNHDRCHPCNGARGERFIEVYRERCRLSDLILTNTTLTLSTGTTVNVSHFPYADTTLDGHEDRHGEVIHDRFAPWRPADDGSWLLCGHVHGSWRQSGRMINVGVDAWGGTPVSEDAIAELIAAGERDLPALPWT